ncbi:hypothetical protein [Peribacillus phoenicis]|uniref:hypothetical protein n=1 Tax=Peribacillus sp. 1P06PA-2 TaxID=3132295 RepID=UPI0039A49F28
MVQSSSLTARNLPKSRFKKVQATITDIAISGKNTLKNIGEELGKKEIPKRISVEQVSLAGGPSLPHVMMEKHTIKEVIRNLLLRIAK